LLELTVVVLSGLVPSILAAQRQPEGTKKIWRIGFLSPYSAEHDKAWRASFHEGMRELGYIEGGNLALEMRHAIGATDRMTALARELVNLKIDLLLVHGSAGTQAAKESGSTIPAIFVANPDPVGLGAVASLALPGGNITGVSDLHTVLGPKRLELLKEILPTASRIGILMDPGSLALRQQLRDLQAAAPALRMQLVPIDMRGPTDLPGAFNKMKQDRVDAFHILGGTAGVHIKRVADLAVANRLPAIATTSKAAEEGILLSYGASFPELYRKAASYVHRVFRGAKPGDLPVEQPTKFELVVNVKTAKALGITIPTSLQLRADDIVQ
jgi:putative ABC transport system substrate-binding protein